MMAIFWSAAAPSPCPLPKGRGGARILGIANIGSLLSPRGEGRVRGRCRTDITFCYKLRSEGSQS